MTIARLALASVGGALAALWCSSAAAGPIDRPADPVVLTGAEVPSLLGIPPGDLVAWRHSGSWEQVRVQVDEREIRDWLTIYNASPIGASGLVYTDPDTFTGPDSDPTLDADDEIAFMVIDTGLRPPSFAAPPGAVPGTGLEITLTDPLDGAMSYVYLFRGDGSSPSPPGPGDVVYDFFLLSGTYLDTYDVESGPNAEDSTVVSSYYGHHFSDRWIDDELRIFAGDATGVDILDRHKNQFAPGNCGRTEDTFSAAEGAFVVNKSGPVRALRSYLGANSGPFTQREHLFYERRHDIRTFLRVHGIPGIVDYFDYSPAAVGMTYRNDRNTGGVPIDGDPDTVVLGNLAWEMVEGPQGGLVIVHTLDTDIEGLEPTSYYLDEDANPVGQCTGDPYAYGSSGPRFDSTIPCTDPVVCASTFNRLVTNRTLYYEAPGITAASAIAHAERAVFPLSVAAAPWPPPSPGAVPAHAAQGAPLLLAKRTGQPQDIDLMWGEACGGSGNAYAVYEGVLGDFTGHLPVDCAVSATELTVTPATPGAFYLVAPVSEVAEGSSGTDSTGAERPVSTDACKPRIPGSCL